MGGWKRRERKEQEERVMMDGRQGAGQKGGRMEGREDGRGEDGRGEEGRGRKKGGRMGGLRIVAPLTTIGGVVVIRLWAVVRSWVVAVVHA